MAVTTTNERLSELAADALVIGVYADSAPSGPAEEFNRASGGLLGRLIEAKEVSQVAVARGAKIPASTLSDVLAGRRGLSIANMKRLARYFGVDPAVFIADE